MPIPQPNGNSQNTGIFIAMIIAALTNGVALYMDSAHTENAVKHRLTALEKRASSKIRHFEEETNKLHAKISDRITVLRTVYLDLEQQVSAVNSKTALIDGKLSVLLKDYYGRQPRPGAGPARAPTTQSIGFGAEIPSAREYQFSHGAICGRLWNIPGGIIESAARRYQRVSE